MSAGDVRYTASLDGIEPDHLDGLFVGWPDPPAPATLLRLLHGSSHVELALDDRTGHVVGFVTAISDGVLTAYVPLLEVLPTHQGRGIGRALVTRLLARIGHLYSVCLHCDPDVEAFYAPFGLRRLNGMALRNYSAQSGDGAEPRSASRG